MKAIKDFTLMDLNQSIHSKIQRFIETKHLSSSEYSKYYVEVNRVVQSLPLDTSIAVLYWKVNQALSEYYRIHHSQTIDIHDVIQLSKHLTHETRIQFDLDFQEFKLFTSLHDALKTLMNEKVILFYGEDRGIVKYIAKQWINEIRNDILIPIELVEVSCRYELEDISNDKCMQIILGNYDTWEWCQERQVKLPKVHIYSPSGSYLFKMVVMDSQVEQTYWIQVNQSHTKYWLISDSSIVSKQGLEAYMDQTIYQNETDAYVALKLTSIQAAVSHLYSVFMPSIIKWVKRNEITSELHPYRINEWIELFKSSLSKGILNELGVNEVNDWDMKYKIKYSVEDINTKLAALLDDMCFESNQDYLYHEVADNICSNALISMYSPYLERIIPEFYRYSLDTSTSRDDSLQYCRRFELLSLLSRLITNLSNIEMYFEGYYKSKVAR